MSFPIRPFQTLATAVLALAAVPAGAPAQIVPDPDCSAAPIVESRVLLSWPAVPTPLAVATQTTTNAALSVANRSSMTLDYELIARMHAGGERRELSLASATLAPFGSATLSVPLAGMGIDIANLRFSGSLSIEARIQDTNGVFIDRAFSPVLYFHRETSGAVRLYRAEGRLATFNGGDLFGTLFSSLPRAVLGVFDGGSGLGFTSEDTGPAAPRERLEPVLLGTNRWEFCMRWVYESIDSGFGEDHYTSGTLMKARGMRVRVDHANWGAPMEFFASQDNGCFSFVAAENTGFVVTVFAEAQLGQGSDITVKAFPTKADSQLYLNDPPQWVFVANPGGVGRRVYYQNEASNVSNLMALGSFVLHWVDVHTQPGLPGPELMLLVNDNPNCSGGGSCQSGNNYVQIEPGKSTRKFLIGHEVGHWLNRQWTGNDLGIFNDTWTANSSDADCAFLGVGSHAMRSKERSAGGFIEGFAHFLSALAWNRHDQTGGIFKYYKEVGDATYADMAAGNWRVDLEGSGGAPLGGVSNWMANMCFVTDGHSVEMDWLRFLWDYRTNAGVKPTHYEILRHVQFTRQSHPWLNSTTAYDRLLDAILDNTLGQAGLAMRFTDLATFNGVAQ